MVIYFSSSWGGLSYYEDGEVAKLPNARSGLRVFDIQIDQKGRLWAGTGDGLYLYDNDTLRRMNSFCCNNEHVKNIKPYKDDQLIVSVMNQIFVLDINDYSSELFYDSESGRSIESMLVVDDDKVWIGTTDLKLFEKGRVVQSYSYSDNAIVRDIKLINNQMWVATFGEGVYRYGADTTHFSIENGLQTDFVDRHWV